MKVTTQNEKMLTCAAGVMELYISDHPAHALTCPANGHCEDCRHAGAVGLREVRYGYEGENHLKWARTPAPLFHLRCQQSASFCSRCVRACKSNRHFLALTIQGGASIPKCSPSQKQSFMDSECGSCGACVQACTDRDAVGKELISMGQAEHSVVTTLRILWCWLLIPRRNEGRGSCSHVPTRRPCQPTATPAVKGRFAIGYATHTDRI